MHSGSFLGYFRSKVEVGTFVMTRCHFGHTGKSFFCELWIVDLNKSHFCGSLSYINYFSKWEAFQGGHMMAGVSEAQQKDT